LYASCNTVCFASSLCSSLFLISILQDNDSDEEENSSSSSMPTVPLNSHFTMEPGQKIQIKSLGSKKFKQKNASCQPPNIESHEIPVLSSTAVVAGANLINVSEDNTDWGDFESATFS